MGSVHAYDPGEVVGLVLCQVVDVVGALLLKAGNADVELGVGLGGELAGLGAGGTNSRGYLYLRTLVFQELPPIVGVGEQVRVVLRIGVSAGDGYPVDGGVLIDCIAKGHRGGLGVGLEHLAHGELRGGDVLGGDSYLLHL